MKFPEERKFRVTILASNVTDRGHFSTCSRGCQLQICVSSKYSCTFFLMLIANFFFYFSLLLPRLVNFFSLYMPFKLSVTAVTFGLYVVVKTTKYVDMNCLYIIPPSAYCERKQTPVLRLARRTRRASARCAVASPCALPCTCLISANQIRSNVTLEH